MKIIKKIYNTNAIDDEYTLDINFKQQLDKEQTEK